ncbi:amidohydrolase family protein [Helicobacter suis]|uniref:amidohydrolase family protein n=1 Tax=Helicobacter suis TaxID=104628 RepID=UPI000CF02A25|nr:amidohydrolase family protein [Helicobacter suis]
MVLKNARLAEGERVDVRVVGDYIVAIENFLSPSQHEIVIDCQQHTLLPSFVDLGVFLHNLQAQTYLKLKKQALRGGVGTLMGIDLTPLYSLNEPDMQPLSLEQESPSPLEAALEQAITFKDPICFHPLNAKERLQNLAMLHGQLPPNSPACLYIYNLEGQKLLPALDYAKMLDLSLVCGVRGYEGRPTLAIMDSSPLAYELGLPSVSPLIQIKEVGKYAAMALHTQLPTMLDSIVELEALKITQAFKSLGAPLLIQTPLHHLILEEQIYRRYDSRAKILPPLKSKDQQEALKHALQNDQIDMLTSLHYTHTPSLKIFEEAPFGMQSIDYLFPLAYTHLVQNKTLTLKQLITLMATNPACFLKANYGEVALGKEARLMLVDLKGNTRVNNPLSIYEGEVLKGRVCQVLQGERVLYAC